MANKLKNLGYLAPGVGCARDATMRVARRLSAFCVFVVAFLATGLAHGWIENHVLGDEITVRVAPDGKAVIEHRLSLHTNGNVRFRKYTLIGVDRDAVPLSNSYVVPAREALSGTLDTATPLKLEVVPDNSGEGVGEHEARSRLEIEVEDEKGLRRGRYVLIIRYRTDLGATGRVQRDGAFMRIAWSGPVFDDGFDNARTTFLVPRAPTPPRAVEELGVDHAESEDPDEPSSTYLTDVRRGEAMDEIELLRTYAPKGEAVLWAVRIDPRALTVGGMTESDPTLVSSDPSPSSSPRSRAEQPIPFTRTSGVWGAALVFLGFVLTWLKSREVALLAARASAEMPPVIPLPGWLRACAAAALLGGGVALQLAFDQVVAGSCLVVGAALSSAYRPARIDPKASMRGPGRWLAVSEREALEGLPRPAGGWLDFSTIRGKLVLGVLIGALAFGVWRLSIVSFWHAVVTSGNVVFLLAVFGTGMGRALPPDMTVEPARFLRQVLRRLRKRKDLEGVRFVPRIRIPSGGVDPDEVRLLIAPRAPLRGFTSIEVGVTYAIGMGARVAMPEVLLRIVAGSPCDNAVAMISRVGRVAPGRKRDERAISFSPRFPTATMTAEIAAAVAIRVLDRAVLERKRKSGDQSRGGQRRAA